MTNLLFYGVVFIGLVGFYAAIMRPFLVHMPILSPAFKAEASFFDQARAKMAGWKTRLTARLVMLAGILVGLYDSAMPYVTTQNWTPVTQRLPDWAIPVGLMLISWIFSYLRKVTENPPQVITQRMEDGSVQVVGLNKPGA